MAVSIIPLSVEETINWSSQEMDGVDLGDTHLNKRTVETVEKLSKYPSGSIPYGCDEWADTKATYGLFKNKKATAEKLRQPHQTRTWERVSQHKCVLAVQDTSFLDYTHYEKMEGLGPIGTEQQNRQGIVCNAQYDGCDPARRFFRELASDVVGAS